MKILEQFTYSDFVQAHDFLILAWAVFDYASTNQIPQWDNRKFLPMMTSVSDQSSRVILLQNVWKIGKDSH